MADNNTMGLTMAVSGEKEFREALSNVNAALKVNITEMSLVTAEYANNREGVEALTAKNKIYETQAASQVDKIKLLQEQTANYTAELGANDTKTLKWQAELNKAQAELAGLNNALESNRDALSKAQEALEKEQKVTVDYEANVRMLSDAINLNGSKTELLNAQYGKNSDSAEALKKKTDLLKDSISKQEQAVTELEKALEQANKEYGTGSAEVGSYEKKLIDAKTSLAKMGNELQDNQKQIDGTTQKTTLWNTVLDKVSDMTGIQLPKDMGKFADSAAGMTVAVGTAFAGASALVVGLYNNMKESVEKVKELTQTANQAGISRQEMEALDYAAKITGVTTDSLTDAFSKVTELMGKANSGNEEAMGVFRRFGVTIRDEVTGELKDADDVFFEISEKLGEIENDTDRNVIAIGLFGDQAKTLYGIFEDGGVTLKAAMQEAWDMGIVKSDEYYDKQMKVNAEIVRATAELQKFKDLAASFFADFITTDFSIKDVLLSLIPGGIFFRGVGNNASGTDYWRGGETWVGENGPEIVRLPRGSQVIPNERTRSSSGDTYIFNVEARNIQEYNDLVRIAENKKMSIRMGYVR